MNLNETEQAESALKPSLLSLFETTKQQRNLFVEDILAKLEDGEVDALKLHLQIKSAEQLIKNFTDKQTNATAASRYAKVVLEAAEKQGKQFDFYNAKWQIKEAGVIYDWEKSEDPVIMDLLSQQEVLKEKIKLRQEFLKTIPISGITQVDEVTGETTKIYPPAKSSTTTVSVTLK